MADRLHWVGTWATTPDPVQDVTLREQTIRIVTHITVDGDQLRIRISNAFGEQSFHIAEAHVGLRSQNADTVPGSGRSLTFNGKPGLTIPAGAPAISDPVNLHASAFTDLVVSLYVPHDISSGFQLTGHDNGHQTNYLSERGNFASAESFPVEKTTASFVLVSGVEVLVPETVGCIVAFGDSLTGGNLSRLDRNHRWPDQLARRLAGRDGGRQFGLVNQGIGGNRLLHDGRGYSGHRRFDRDVLGQSGATHVILALGINDLRNSSKNADEIVSADELSAGLLPRKSRR